MASRRPLAAPRRFSRLLWSSPQKRFLSYADTVQNLRINSETRVIFQGFTGRQATFDAKQSLEYGTKIVGGVRPGKDGEHLGLPVVPSMKAVSAALRGFALMFGYHAESIQAMEHLKPDATAVYVAAPGAAAAIEEAIEAEIPLIVAVAEFIPLHDMLRVQEMLRTQSRSRLVGPNCPGMINPHAKCRIGFPPIPFFQPGSVGIVSKSGTLSYETVASTTRAGIGQSLVIGIGGDPLPGTNFVDALKIFEHDENTKGIIVVGEIGGEAEQEAAEWILEYRKRTSSPKPIMALIAGIQAPQTTVMGHSGAIYRKEEERALTKIQKLKEAGVVMTDHPEKFGDGMKAILVKGSKTVYSAPQREKPPAEQRRGIHTIARLPRGDHFSQAEQQRRQYRVPAHQLNLATKLTGNLRQAPRLRLGFFVERSTYGPCVRLADCSKEEVLRLGIEDEDYTSAEILSTNIDMTYAYGLSEAAFKSQFEESVGTLKQENAHASERTSSMEEQIKELAETAWHFACLFANNEATNLDAEIVYNIEAQQWQVLWTDADFDDSAYKSPKRQGHVYQFRDTSTANPAALEGEKYGIVYVRLPGDGNIATIVNGAGLAMNTVDALVKLDAHPTNFLDTGGKATSETVSQSFRTVLTDSRVKAIFVNIFGGLTLCDMIARGVIQAYKEVGIEVPVVVRLRGTNEKEGQKLIAESGLPIEAFDDFEGAANRVKELASKSHG